MAKQLEQQRFIFKIHSSRLRKAKWKMILSIDEARKNEEVISLASSQVLRWIDELNGMTDCDKAAVEIKAEIRRLKKEKRSQHTIRQIKALYKELDNIQFKPDYMCLIIDRKSDYFRACKGFSINGVPYHRLLGTNGGIKNSTIVFVSERHYGELQRRIENGRHTDKALITAKLEAYKALACSASIPVSMPNKILVVKDCFTEFKSDVIQLNDEGVDEPETVFIKDCDIRLDASDGFGLMMPSLAKRWSRDLDIEYTTCGVCIRYAWTKGMVFTFDFVDFAEKIAGKTIVTDIWGNDVDIRDVDLVLTESMVKLWDFYDSCDSFLNTSTHNGYSFGVTKVCPEQLESERSLNYQFIQSYDLSDDDVEGLVSPTLNEIKDVLGGDWRKTVLFLKGKHLNEDNVKRLPCDFIKALMVDDRMIDDPFVQSNTYRLIRKRIDDAKVGVLKVHGNYSVASGDPFALCQSFFGLPVTGLLKSGEIYNKYWSDEKTEKLVCFRAPMSTHENIRKVYPAAREGVEYWYRYMTACTVFNAWDTSMIALNGMDFDGDLVFLTDNEVLCRNHRELPALKCVQRKAEKCIPIEEDFIQSNIDSFGNDIGKVTNRVTSMYDVQSFFDAGSKEHKELGYRIKSGQQYQQNSIDKSKGIISNPMPKSWYDWRSAKQIEDDEKRSFYSSILADKKPYFMIYIYPDLKRKYNTYIKNVNRNALREFGMTINEIESLPYSELSERQIDFLARYHNKMPVSNGDSVMNRICRRFEKEFDGHIGKYNSTHSFDYTIMKSGVEYSDWLCNEIKRLYRDYVRQLQNYAMFAVYERIDDDASASGVESLRYAFTKKCSEICPERDVLCDILLDICYTRSNTKRFAWSVCGYDIVENLLNKNNRIITFPTLDSGGDIYCFGETFSMSSTRLEVIE